MSTRTEHGRTAHRHTEARTSDPRALPGAVVFLVSLPWLLGACRDEAPTVTVPRDTIALVNGAPLTAHEVLLQQRAPSPFVAPGGAVEAQGGLAPQAALDALVLLELQAQRAVALGLDRDPDYAALVDRAEAGLRDLKRRELAKRFRTKELMEKSGVTDEVARAYFDVHAARVQTLLSVRQLVFRDRASGEAALAELAAGKSFDELGAAQLPGLPKEERPWERNALPWDQVPAEWWPAVDALQPGQRSELIPGPRGRFWLVEVVERRSDASLTFERVKPRIQAVLKADAYQARRAQLERELRDRARVELLKPLGSAPTPGPMPPAAAAEVAPRTLPTSAAPPGEGPPGASGAPPSTPPAAARSDEVAGPANDD